MIYPDKDFFLFYFICVCVCVCVCVLDSDTSRGPYYCKCKLSSFNPVKIKLLCLKFEGCLAKSGDSDKMLYSAVSDLGVHCLCRPVYPNT